MISETATNDMIRAWKRARLSRDCSQLDYPKINILHPKHGIGEDEVIEDSDAEFVQGIVDRMPGEIRSSFEAFHLGVINGEFCRRRSHKWRCWVLGIDKKQYKSRRLAGHRIIGEYLLTASGDMVL